MKISNIYFNKAYSILDNTLLNVIDNIVLRWHMKNNNEIKKENNNDKKKDIAETLTQVPEKIKKESKKEATKIGDSDRE